MPRAKTHAELMREADVECERIMNLTDAEIHREHLALYENDPKLAQRAIDFLRAKIMDTIARTRKH